MSKISGIDELRLGVRAGFPMFYCETIEPERCKAAIEAMVREALPSFGIYNWDSEISNPDELIMSYDPNDEAEAQAVINSETYQKKSLEGTPNMSIWIAKNLNWFIRDDMGDRNKEIMQYLQNRHAIFARSANRKVLVIMSDEPFELAIPEAIQKLFMPIRFDLPNPKELESYANDIIESVKSSKSFTPPEDLGPIIESCRGMTAVEAMNAMSFSLLKSGGRLDPESIAMLRSKEIEKIPGLSVAETNGNLDEPQGYDVIKEFILSTIDHPNSKGLILLGPPGTGKSLLSKWIGKTNSRIMFEVELAQMMGDGLLGQAEKAMARFIDVIKATGRCILFVDEIEKGLSGVGGQSGDGGATKRSMGQFLKFLSDGRPQGVYVIATCNNIQSLPPEWVRAERWDSAPFFIDLPGEPERQAILDYYLSKFGVQVGKNFGVKQMEGWSGAEIKSVCRIAQMYGRTCAEVKQFVIPVSQTMGAEIKQLREWADGKTIPASVKVPKAKAVKTDAGELAIDLN